MDSAVASEIFRALHEEKWLTIEYCNTSNETKLFWIGVKDIIVRPGNPAGDILEVEGMQLGTLFMMDNAHLFGDKILSAHVIDGTYYYCEKREKLIQDIADNPSKYRSLFKNTPTLKILDYLVECNKLDSTPEQAKDYTLVESLDIENVPPEGYPLSDKQFREIVNAFNKKTYEDAANQGKPKGGKQKYRQLGMNILSIENKKHKQLYILAYKKLSLNVKQKMLKPEKKVTLCREFTIDGDRESIERYLNPDEYGLLDDVIGNLETLNDIIEKCGARVDNRPYFLAVETAYIAELPTQYAGIIKLYDDASNNKGKVTLPIQAFFGSVTARPRRIKNYPLAILDKNKADLDQLLAIHTAMKYPLTYVQGPPGTGKTTTIVNTIITAFFNERSVLFSSFNNTPVNGVFEKLNNLFYQDKKIRLPILRLGNKEYIKDAIKSIRELYNWALSVDLSNYSQEKDKAIESHLVDKLSAILERHEVVLSLKEKQESIISLLNGDNPERFERDLSERQLKAVENELNNIVAPTEDEAISHLPSSTEKLARYLYYRSAKLIQRLKEPKYEELWRILSLESESERVKVFTWYITNNDKFELLLRVFPIILTTDISASKLGDPKPHFDMVILDEASQCKLSTALIPIVRGDRLMLVGDPQQLNPVVILDTATNELLKKKYKIDKEYDYCNNSIYKTYTKCDFVSDELLLSSHYRSRRKIISFCNEKYYENKLVIKSKIESKHPLVFIDLKGTKTDFHNTSPAEVNQIIRLLELSEFKDKSIGIITPFVNQMDLINEELSHYQYRNIHVGTVHKFQGDEKDIIIFSLAITGNTKQGTYNWLKNNDELINVAASRPRESLILLGDGERIDRLHELNPASDNLYDLVQYIKSDGEYKVTPKKSLSRALGFKPYSTQTEEAFKTSLSHGLGVILKDIHKYSVVEKAKIADVFRHPSDRVHDLFYTGHFDFVVYCKEGSSKYPVLAFELDGKEHFDNETVMARDAEKNAICKEQGFDLIRVENSYARRYYYIKGILQDYFMNKEECENQTLDNF